MIVREIKNMPKEALMMFDYFNDYDDTRKWAEWNCPEVVDILDKGYALWKERYCNKATMKPLT